MTSDYPAAGARPSAKRWLPAEVAESRWAAAVVLAAAAGAVVLTMPAGPRVLQTGGKPVILLLACVPIVVLRRWPLPVLGVLAAVTGLVTSIGSASLPLGFLLGLAMYFSALRLPRPTSIALTAAVVAVLGATVVYSACTLTRAPVASEIVENLVPLAGAWFIADSVTARRSYQAGLAAQAARERGAEVREERLRIAREMHDVVAHALAVITVQAGVGRCLAGKDPQEVSVTFGSIETIGRSAQDELRVMLGLLRDGEAATALLAPVPGLIDIEDLADMVRASGVSLELRVVGLDRRLSPLLELSIYRVIQEALTNIVKHAPGAGAAVELSVSAAAVRLEVRDDGGPGGGGPGGGRTPRTGLAAGHGIVGMRERIGAFGGWLVAGPVAGGGFQVSAEVPIEAPTQTPAEVQVEVPIKGVAGGVAN
jgi:signal transduction histidine kinase